ncbi:hypothetical protein [Rhizobium oryzicola]|uniref:Uncharacterized protein n=1 Tax=Rhizobium oryzicola TaxID=1232668 RepID=A0ABT8SR48_9HYPH|nr:hypothetical protein [Rhizobium oryzicola]MDO1580905.1 hypothetical protein [Rhizobium oryzicola]
MITITVHESLSENQARYRERERREQQREEERRALERTVWDLAHDLHREGKLTRDSLANAVTRAIPEHQRKEAHFIADSYCMRNRSTLGIEI